MGLGSGTPGAAVAEVIARHSASFDMYTGRLFAVSLLPGSPDRLVLTASRLCVDDASWQTVVEDLVRQYDECAGASTVGILVSAAGRRAGLPTEG